MKEHLTILTNNKCRVWLDVLIDYTFEPSEVCQYKQGDGFHPPMLSIENVKVVGISSCGATSYMKSDFGDWQKDLDTWAYREVIEITDNIGSLLYEELTDEY